MTVPRDGQLDGFLDGPPLTLGCMNCHDMTLDIISSRSLPNSHISIYSTFTSSRCGICIPDVGKRYRSPDVQVNDRSNNLKASPFLHACADS